MRRINIDPIGKISQVSRYSQSDYYFFFAVAALLAVAFAGDFAAGAFAAVALAAGALALAAGALLGADFAGAAATLFPGFAAFGLLTVLVAFGAAALPVVAFLTITQSLL